MHELPFNSRAFDFEEEGGGETEGQLNSLLRRYSSIHGVFRAHSEAESALWERSRGFKASGI